MQIAIDINWFRREFLKKSDIDKTFFQRNRKKLIYIIDFGFKIRQITEDDNNIDCFSSAK